VNGQLSSCGRGRDVERINRNEMRTMRGCEREFVIGLRR
jgi:hypothetical protein